MYYDEHAGTNGGILVEHEDGRKGIVRHEDQKKEFPRKRHGALLVTMTDDDFKPNGEKLHIISEDKLFVKGYID